LGHVCYYLDLEFTVLLRGRTGKGERECNWRQEKIT